MFALAVAGGVGALVVLFLGELLSWAGIPAIGAAALGAAGVLASEGKLSLWAVLVVGVVGAEVGGVIGWWIGRWAALRRRTAEAIARERERTGRLVERGRRAIATGERLEERLGGVMVFFVPSWVSGRLGMPARRFVVWNLVASILWTAVAGLGAYGVGSVFRGRSLVHTLVPILIAAVALMAIALAFRTWRRSHEGRRTLAGLVGQPMPPEE